MVTHLSVRVYDREERVITAPVESNPLFKLFTAGQEPDIVGKCVRRCFAESAGSSVVVEHKHGLGVVGSPFTNQGETVCVGIAGYALITHLDQLQLRRLAHAPSPSSAYGSWFVRKFRHQ